MHTPLFRALVRALQLARRANHEATDRPWPRPRAVLPLSRRQFLRSALAGSAALAAGGLARPAGAGALARQQVTPRIAVVGGGLAGLNAAFQLQKAGLAAEVYEARARLGGRVRTVHDTPGAGLTVELGGEFINSDHADMLALAAELGLTLFDRARDAARFPLPETAYLFDGRSIPEAEVAEALRPLARQIADDAALLDAGFDRYAPDFDRLSVARYLDQHADKLGAPFIRALIERAIRTELGVEAGETSALHLLFLLPTVDGEAVEVLGASDELFTVDGGTSRIIEGLAARLEGHVHTRHVLTSVAERGDGYRLCFAGGQTVDTDYLILAIPFAVLRDVELKVRLPSKLRRFIKELDSGRNEKLIAEVSRRAWRQPGGFSTEAWTDLGFAAAWDGTQRQADREDGALTLFFGGDEVPAMSEGSAHSQGRRLIGELNQVLPGVEEAATGHFVRSRWSTDPFSRGAYVTFRPGQYTRFGEFLYIESDDPEERQEVVVGRLAFAGEHLSDAFYGYMNGAAETGRLAADAVVRQVLVAGQPLAHRGAV